MSARAASSEGPSLKGDMMLLDGVLDDDDDSTFFHIYPLLPFTVAVLNYIILLAMLPAKVHSHPLR